MLIGLLQTLRQLLGYTLVATLLISPFGWYCLLHAVLALLGVNYSKRLWIGLDILACTACHDTLLRTISGWSGQYMHHSKRYYYQAKFIDRLAMWFGNEPNHCWREYQSELKRGLVK